MGWKKNRQPKQSISSVTSMSFLTDQNLTFHRFSDGTISCEARKAMQPGQVWTTGTVLDYSTTNPTLMVNDSATSTSKILSPADEAAEDDSVNKRYSTYSSQFNNSAPSTPHPTYTGSTMKLIQVKKEDSSDSANKQSRCSIFRGTILCLCMNLTYANIVRFPRELERHGIAFLVPYMTLMLFIGVPIVLLEMALGQFLGQGAAHSWKASPFFKGASIVGRIASWLGTIWVSMQMSLALLYIGQISFSSVPFKLRCPSGIQKNLDGYEEVPMIGQACLKETFLRPVWDYSVSFGLLAIGLVFLWVIIMMCTHSSRINRRSLLMFGIVTLGLLLFETGWQVTSIFQVGSFPELWPFQLDTLHQSSTWFYALIQVIFSTQIGVGAIPVMTGKFLYKGDAIRTCVVYMCFNFLITIIATAYFMTTFGQHNSSEHNPPFPDLTTITSIYDRAFVEEENSLLRSLIPSLAYLMVIIAGLSSVSIAIYTSTRLFKRHPNYIMCLGGMFVAIGCFICPNFLIGRQLDLRWVGLAIIVALVFDIISIAWIYGSKDLAVDLEFSIGRPIMRLWLVLWSCIPLVLIGIVAWWIAVPSSIKFDPIIDLIPRWIPIVVCIVIIILFSGYAVSKQVDYNMFNMIHEATRPAKDWGPADPLVRHAWKQWKSVCDDTGQRDFTLRRRGTKDWTSSIKKGQYSHASRNQNIIGSSGKYYVNGKQTTTSITGGSNSPNYSGSVFGDSAIEEDMNSDKYPSNQLEPYSRSRKSSTKRSSDASQRSTYIYHQHQLDNERSVDDTDDDATSNMHSNYHSQKIPIRIASNGRRQENFTSRIEILPPESPAQFHATQSTFMTKNPLSLHLNDVNFSGPFNDKYGHHLFQQDFHHHQIARGGGHLINNIHIGDYSEGSGSLSTKTTNTATTHNQHDQLGWRKLPRNADEFSTEL